MILKSQKKIKRILKTKLNNNKMNRIKKMMMIKSNKIILKILRKLKKILKIK